MNRLLPTRRLIPRWRKAKFAIDHPDMLGLVKPTTTKVSLAADVGNLERDLHAWNASGSIGELADILSYGVDPSQRERLADAARAALKLDGTTPAMRLVAQEILEPGTSLGAVWSKPLDARQSIRALRTVLRDAPNDVVALVDLAQHHLSHGKRKAAARALVVAHDLSPDSVHVLRAVARYLVHIGQEDAAHAFIKGAKRLSVDPWLMASEIALAQVANGQSTQLRKAQRAISTKSFSNRDVSELAAAVGGAELMHGNLKAARKLFRLALERPNDNVLAQAITNQSFLQIEVDDQVIRRSPSHVFEGRALQALSETKFAEASAFMDCWAEEEPFSSRPRMLQSFVNGALGNYEEAKRAAEIGLIADPLDLSLRGNKAYALAALGKLDEAVEQLDLIDSHHDEHYRPTNEATRGMVAIMRGDAEHGRELYERALEAFEKRRDKATVTDCMAFMARTMVRAAAAGADEVVKRALERYKKEPSPAAAVILRELEQVIKEERSPEMRKTVQWEWEPATNTLREKRGLTHKGAPSFVVASPDKLRE
jgi:tetratricopeptide (TPR) repeat protein